MKKRNLLTTTALATALLVGKNPIINSNANAQIKNFSGPYISFGVTASYDEVKRENDLSRTPTASALLSSSTNLTADFIGFNSSATTIIGRAASSIQEQKFNFKPQLNLGYTFPVSNDFGIGIDVAYSHDSRSRTTSSNYTQSTMAAINAAAAASSYSITNATGSQSIRIKDQYNIALSIKPSLAVTQDLMLYGMGSVNQLKQKVNVNFSLDTATNYGLSKEVFGYGLGVGARYNLDKNLYFDLSATSLTYDRYRVSRNDSNVTPTLANVAGLDTSVNNLTTTIRPEYYDIKLSIGYKF